MEEDVPFDQVGPKANGRDGMRPLPDPEFYDVGRSVSGWYNFGGVKSIRRLVEPPKRSSPPSQLPERRRRNTSLAGEAEHEHRGLPDAPKPRLKRNKSSARMLAAWLSPPRTAPKDGVTRANAVKKKPKRHQSRHAPNLGRPRRNTNADAFQAARPRKGSSSPSPFSSVGPVKRGGPEDSILPDPEYYKVGRSVSGFNNFGGVKSFHFFPSTRRLNLRRQRRRQPASPSAGEEPRIAPSSPKEKTRASPPILVAPGFLSPAASAAAPGVHPGDSAARVGGPSERPGSSPSSPVQSRSSSNGSHNAHSTGHSGPGDRSRNPPAVRRGRGGVRRRYTFASLRKMPAALIVLFGVLLLVGVVAVFASGETTPPVEGGVVDEARGEGEQNDAGDNGGEENGGLDADIDDDNDDDDAAADKGVDSTKISVVNMRPVGLDLENDCLFITGCLLSSFTIDVSVEISNPFDKAVTMQDLKGKVFHFEVDDPDDLDEIGKLKADKNTVLPPSSITSVALVLETDFKFNSFGTDVLAPALASCEVAQESFVVELELKFKKSDVVDKDDELFVDLPCLAP